jgi:uncharacterized membrane protein (DUF373 family)
VKRFLDLDFRKRWSTFSIYEKFEHLIISLLTAIIAAIVGAATWQLVLHTVALVRGHLLDPGDPQVFQAVFGMILTVLIAMEFKHSLLVVLHHQRDIVQIRSVVLIALLALVRKFIILDIYQTQPAVVFALAAASLSLGIVFWLVRNEDDRGPSSEDPERNADGLCRHIPMFFDRQPTAQRREYPADRLKKGEFYDAKKKMFWKPCGHVFMDVLGCRPVPIGRGSPAADPDPYASRSSLCG